MVAGTRRVVWGASAQVALDEALTDIADSSLDGALRVMTRAIEVAASLSTFAERGRVVPEIGESTLRELFVYQYRLLYRVREDRVVRRRDR